MMKAMNWDSLHTSKPLSDGIREWTPDTPLLSLRNLNVSFLVGRTYIDIVRDLSLDISAGGVVCIIGETGCGKSVTASAALHLLPDNARTQGKILFKGVDVSGWSDKEFRRLRGSHIMSIPQNPTASLNPLMRVGPQVAECHQVIAQTRHVDNLVEQEAGAQAAIPSRLRKKRKERMKARVVELFDRLKLPNPDTTYGRYPSELSGGMNQRVLISMGAIAHPELLVVDEPTKAIDWSLRQDVLKMLQELKEDTSCAMMLITHDIPLARRIADQVAVMYAGRIVEWGPADAVLHHPLHPYTRGLLDSLPENQFKPMEGFMPAFDNIPAGCAFLPRCPVKDEACGTSDTPPQRACGDRFASCHHPLLGCDAL